MSAAKKFKDNYPKDKRAADSEKDKRVIEQYVKKIEDLLKKDPKAQKKAAQIVQALINSKNNK